MKTSVIYSSDANITGPVLVDYLTQRGVYDEQAKPVVFYGYPSCRVKHNLNGSRRSGKGKIANMQNMVNGGCRVVPWWDTMDVYGAPPSAYPLLARKLHGMGGTDIVPVFQKEELLWRISAGWNWFSSYVPLETEFRTWIFRGQHLDTYEKVMHRPADYKFIGRNFRNGFDFVPTAARQDTTEQAILALDALGLDFGAIDMLLGKDGQMYVLEVNTAPGVVKSEAQATLAKLADCIAGWVRDGYPERETA